MEVVKMVDNKQGKSGYGPNNPEPQEFKDSATADNETDDALHSSLEYINGQATSTDTAKPHMPCKNSLPT
jgi:hypothetical protein